MGKRIFFEYVWSVYSTPAISDLLPCVDHVESVLVGNRISYEKSVCTLFHEDGKYSDLGFSVREEDYEFIKPIIDSSLEEFIKQEKLAGRLKWIEFRKTKKRGAENDR